MTQVVESQLGHDIEHLTGALNYRDHLLFAGIYKVAHPDRGNIPLDELRDRLESFTDPNDQRSALFVARSWSHARIVGAAMIHLADSVDERIGHIEEIFVRETARGRNLGRGLLKASVDFAERGQADVVQLDPPPANDAAHRLFASMDFVPSSAGVPRLQLSERV